ncbi:unnamed protein product [Dibothriocephalus latus]|uniref:Uncharacterized protein n=1 Tax=Dibothriocephalus latus TaxID=60516 RepID=A0A3P7N2A4_DIBLA|nr:unnamed protein product [Dibothriocephalus latus]
MRVVFAFEAFDLLLKRTIFFFPDCQGGRRVISCHGTGPTYPQKGLKPSASGAALCKPEAVDEEPIIAEQTHLSTPQDRKGGEEAESKPDAHKQEGDQREIIDCKSGA